MGKLIVTAQMSLDAVVEFDEGWYSGDGGPRQRERGLEQLVAAEALVLGRDTYQGLAEYWPEHAGDGSWADGINPKPKFVASRTLSGSLDWNASVLDNPVEEAVADLKQRLDGDLLSFGCGGLARHLAGHGLVDEVWLWVHPVVFGRGDQVFHQGDPIKLTLIECTAFESGVTLQRYRPA